MTLHNAPLLYVFFETFSLEHQRELCEGVIELPVIENQFYPPHEYHGLVKYDGGQVVLSLNLSSEHKFLNGSSDGMITVMTVDDTAALYERMRSYGYNPPQAGGLFTDAYGHHYIFREALLAGDQRLPAVQELRLTVTDLPASLAFYGDVLGLDLLERTKDRARFATGTVDLVLCVGGAAPDGRTIIHNKYLIVFHTAAIEATHAALIQRGLRFKAGRVGYSDIGGTARFVDPSGHVLCLYAPSTESLTWGSGAKVKTIIAACEKERTLC